MKYTPEILDRLHAELLDITEEVLRVCRQSGIKCFVQGGTAIGTFFYDDIIPWDDDIDLGMLRPDYDRFVAEAPALLGKDYFMQEFSTEPSTPFYHVKVRRRNTLFVETPYRNMPIEQGIYVDIFPFDRIPDNRYMERLHRSEVRFWITCFTSCSVWLWKPFARKGQAVRLPKSFVGAAAIKIVMALMGKRAIERRMYRALTRYDKKECRRVNIARMPLDQIDIGQVENCVEGRLGRLTVPVPADVERYLRHHYPWLSREVPAEKQINHAPEILSFSITEDDTYE